MESKKFYLNPNAPVFVPSNLTPSQEKSINLDSDPADQEAKGVARSRCSDAPTNANVFSESFELDHLSQVTGEIREFMGDPFPSGSDEQAQISPNDIVASDLRSLSLMFPGYSEESVLDIYAANDGDIEAAKEMLAHLEGVGDKSMS
ncbi:uncharacterized protein LOC116256488 [Nymphaea colorata]|nr:uncharacterized protein LOC116256488 [Nymphaea colorata]XP_031488724.1 uncharacterized protein LOC116256488 [Nymphaea colorata]